MSKNIVKKKSKKKSDDSSSVAFNFFKKEKFFGVKKRVVSNYFKHKNELRRYFFVFVFILFFFFVSSLIFQLRSNYAEQIIMESYPQYISVNLKQGEEKNISFKTSIKTSLFCKASCSYSFRDLSFNELLDYGSFEFHSFNNHVFETVLSIDGLGKGQKLFLYEVKCDTISSRICSSPEFPVSRTSLITFNYELSDEQKFEKEEVEKITQEITVLFSSAQSNILSAEATLSAIEEMKKVHLERELLKLSFFEEILEQDLMILDEVWETQNYSFINQIIVERNLMEKSLYFNQNSDNLIKFIQSEKETYNYAVNVLNHLESNLSFIEDLKIANDLARLQEPSPSLSRLFLRGRTLNNLLDSHENFNSYADMKSLVFEIENLSFYLKEFYSSQLLNESDVFLEAEVFATLMRNDLCLLESGAVNCNNEINFTSGKLNDSEKILNLSNNICEEISSLENSMQLLGVIQDEKRANLSLQELIDVDLEKKRVEASMILWHLNNTNSESGLRNILNNYSSPFLDDFFVTSNYYPLNYSVDKQNYFLSATYLEQGLEEFLGICNFERYKFPSINIFLEKAEDVFVDAPNISVIREVSANCCFDSVCVPCCDYYGCRVESRNPLIVVHGYSFYSFNSALHSVNAYNDFINLALLEGLYFPAGVIGPNYYPDYEEYDLTRNFVPPVFKATYYEVLNFEDLHPSNINPRSGSIFEYADNLHELVERVRNVTGRDQVDLVAHSMGGLVTRVYIDKYGDDSLGKIILVGTPNKGVPARLLHLCKFFGGLNECDEMYEKSPFMYYLNEEVDEPEKEVYMLIGRGCNTFGADGDGIVQTQSAELDFANIFYFDSTCDLIDNFHRDMIKPTKQPDIYDKIVSILLS